MKKTKIALITMSLGLFLLGGSQMYRFSSSYATKSLLTSNVQALCQESPGTQPQTVEYGHQTEGPANVKEETSTTSGNVSAFGGSAGGSKTGGSHDYVYSYMVTCPSSQELCPFHGLVVSNFRNDKLVNTTRIPTNQY